jgi:hypothetical protein
MLTRTPRTLAVVTAGLLAASVGLSACGTIGEKKTETTASGASIDVGSGKLKTNKMKNVALIMNYDLSATYSVSLVDAAKALAKKEGINLDVKFDKLQAPTELAH